MNRLKTYIAHRQEFLRVMRESNLHMLDPDQFMSWVEVSNSELMRLVLKVELEQVIVHEEEAVEST